MFTQRDYRQLSVAKLWTEYCDNPALKSLITTLCGSLFTLEITFALTDSLKLEQYQMIKGSILTQLECLAATIRETVISTEEPELIEDLLEQEKELIYVVSKTV